MNNTGNGWAIAAALAAAVASTWGWAPQGWWPLVPIAFGLLMHALALSRNPWAAWWLGWAFGTISQLAGHHWMYTAMVTKAGVAPVEAALQFSVLCLYLGLSTGIATMVWKVLHRHDTPHAGFRGLVAPCISFALLITLAEWTRSVSFAGFSSLSIGYAFIDTWMRGYMPIGGVWGTSFVVMLATAFACRIPQLVSRTQQVLAAFAATCTLVLGAGLTRITWVQTSGAPLSYRLLQPNVAQDLKFDPGHVSRQLDELTHQLESGPADIILTPETAVPLFFTQLPVPSAARWQAWSTSSNSHLFIGMPMLSEAGQAHNSVLHIGPAPQTMAVHHKIRLMPFGEYTPKGLEWTTRNLALPLKDLVAGSPGQPAFQGAKHQDLGVLTCQEDAVPADARRVADHAGVILNPSNLAWFDESAAMAQRLQMVRARALETGRPILRSANTGITAHIDHRGDIKATAPPNHRTTLAGVVQAMQGQTPYVLLGDMPFIALALTWLGITAAVTVRFRFGLHYP
ncbi:MAG: apolipoprotein N-acyltransferase [Pseudomonadota bacterium]